MSSPTGGQGAGSNSQQQQQQQSSSSSSASLLLDGDGILTQLFYFIWRMKCSAVVQSGGGSTTTGTYNPLKPPKSDDPAVQAVMDLCVPSTVILEHNFPKYWYARAADLEDDDPAGSGGAAATATGSASRAALANSAPPERRTGKDIDSASIMRAFRVPEGSNHNNGGGDNSNGKNDDGTSSAGPQPPGPGDAVASYYAEATDDEGRACTRVEFLDQEGVKGLLIRRTRRPDGILQCFVSPCGKQNSVVQVIWSPHVVHVTRRRNRFPLRDTRLPVYDRSVTYEGLAHYSDEVFVAPHVRLQATLVCEELVRSFREVHRVMIQRMVLYFKSDSAGRLWFLFGNSIRVAERIPPKLKDRRLVALSLRGMKPQDRVDAENNQSSRLARMLRDEAYEVKAAHDANSKMQEYYRAHKRLRQAAKEEPIIRALVGTPLAPYAQYRPKPPTLGPIGDTYYPRPVSRAGAEAAAAAAAAAATGAEDEEAEDGGAGDDVASGMGPGSPAASTAAGGDGGPASPRRPASGANLTRLVSKIRTATMLGGGGAANASLSPPSQRQLTNSLSCIVPPLYGATGTLRGGSLALFGGSGGASAASPRRAASGYGSSADLSASPSASASSGTFLSKQQQQQFAGRSAAQLWQVARLAVFSGAVRTFVLRVELREFIKSFMYALYSHFSSESVLASKTSAAALRGAPVAQRPFRVVVPRSYFEALGDEWWEDLGFSKVKLFKVAEAVLTVPPPPPPKPKKKKTKPAPASPLSLPPGSVAQQYELQRDDDADGDEPHQNSVSTDLPSPVLGPASVDGNDPDVTQIGGGEDDDSGAVDASNNSPPRSPTPDRPAGAVKTAVDDRQAPPPEDSNNNNNNDDPYQLALKHYTQEQLDVRAKTMMQISLTSHPDDTVLEVAGLAAPLLHVQAKVEALMRRRIDLPAAKNRFFYAGHRVVMDRKKASKFASVVRKTWIAHKTGGGSDSQQ